MTDKDVIQALECCIKPTSDCDNCPYYGYDDDLQCFDMSQRDALDLINRQQAEIEKHQAERKIMLEEDVYSLADQVIEQQAEIERFKKIETTVNEFWCVVQKFTREKLKEKPTLEELLEYIEHAKAETIKEFAERLKELMHTKFKDLDVYEFEYVTENEIDRLVKEMVGEGK